MDNRRIDPEQSWRVSSTDNAVDTPTMGLPRMISASCDDSTLMLLKVREFRKGRRLDLTETASWTEILARTNSLYRLAYPGTVQAMRRR